MIVLGRKTEMNTSFHDHKVISEFETIQLNQSSIRDVAWLSSSLKKETLIIARHIAQLKTMRVRIDGKNEP